MRIATWNINNVVKRLDLLSAWLRRTQPDVVALQELKTPTADFPGDALRDLGYESLVLGQRTWNGVALLARGHEPLPVVTALPGDPKDKEARYVEAAIHGVLYACLYLPNGNPWPGPKFDYKMRWFERMRLRAAELWASGQPVILLGDWNVVPTDDDIYKPDTWRDNALLQPEPRAAFASVLSQGWTDAVKQAHPGKKFFTFWDYRRKRWERDAGLRIDHILFGSFLPSRGRGRRPRRARPRGGQRSCTRLGGTPIGCREGAVARCNEGADGRTIDQEGRWHRDGEGKSDSPGPIQRQTQFLQDGGASR